jgi:hypothetical protein
MGFIQKSDPVVLNIKLTSIGREQLAKGQLTFNSFAVGDGEIDYSFNNRTGFNAFLANILRPADVNPRQLSFITRNLSGDPYNLLGAVSQIPTFIQNVAKTYGFFSPPSGFTTNFLTDPNHVKQPDAMVKINEVTGGTMLNLYQAPTYQANVNEPAVNDFILIRWTNPMGVNTTGYTINSQYASPYLFYKIQKVYSGTSLAANNLMIDVDRELPNFDLSGGSIVAGAIIYRNLITVTGDSFSTDFISGNIFSFMENCQSPMIEYPFWNMSIVFTDEIVGIQLPNKPYGQLPTNAYGGFVSYIQNQAPKIKKLGVIHYTNPSPANTYGESLYLNTPVLYLPTIMWHKTTGTTLGLVLRAIGSQQLLTGVTHSLNTTYYNMADVDGNIVGKVFNDLQLFTIEDQELLFAMSYKSNRSWTLPQADVDVNSNVILGGCGCDLFVNPITGFTPTTIGGTDGGFIINVSQSSGNPIFIEISILSGSTVFTGLYSGGTMFISGFGLGTYIVTVYDTGGGANCHSHQTVTIINPTTVELTDIDFINS